MSSNYVVEHARSGRSSCKACKSKIEQGALRCGVEYESSNFTGVRWYHAECTRLPKALSDPSEYEGFDDLSTDAQAEFVDILGSAVRTRAKKRARGGKQEAKEDTNMKALKKMRVVELKAALKEMGESTKGRKAELVERLAAASAPKVDSDTKKLHEANNQLRTGKKSELLARIADAKVFGCMPKCPRCYGGTLRMTYDSREGHKGAGTYRCPGFMDDDEFVRCSFRIHTSDASAPSRPKWQDPSDD